MAVLLLSIFTYYFEFDRPMKLYIVSVAYQSLEHKMFYPIMYNLLCKL